MDVNHENKRFYRYIKENNTFLGELVCHFDEERDMYFVDVIVYAPYRKKGCGCQALLMLCEIASDNPSIKMFLKCGFTEVSRTGEYVLVRKNFSER